MNFKVIGVVGAGQMGSGIAHAAAASGFDVILNDTTAALAERGKETIDRNLERGVLKGKMSPEEKGSILNRIRVSHHTADLKDSDLVVEAIVENEMVKRDLFAHLDDICRPGVILATNTSSISVTRIAASTKRPGRVIGMHFMNPVPVMKLVEIIRGIATTDETFAEIRELAEKMGKTPVEVNDFPGFVSNRVLMPMINEAMFCLYEGVARPEAIDTVMKLGMNHPMGPLELADFIGLDTCLSILRTLHSGLGDDKYRPCPLLVKMVDAGWLGKKSGRGFYVYAG